MKLQEYYDILQIGEDATDEEIEAKYHELRKKYSEDRFLEGEAGNEAARMLNKLDNAYVELRAARRERSANVSGENAFREVEELIRKGDISAAQSKLDSFNERSAEWHYLQSVVFYKKNWINECKKQLEIAMEMDASNSKYKNSYQKLNDKLNYETKSGGANNTYNPQSGSQPVNPEDEQMGGNWCSNCVSCCYTYMCVNCCFNLCCGCR